MRGGSTFFLAFSTEIPEEDGIYTAICSTFWVVARARAMWNLPLAGRAVDQAITGSVKA